MKRKCEFVPMTIYSTDTIIIIQAPKKEERGVRKSFCSDKGDCNLLLQLKPISTMRRKTHLFLLTRHHRYFYLTYNLCYETLRGRSLKWYSEFRKVPYKQKECSFAHTGPYIDRLTGTNIDTIRTGLWGENHVKADKLFIVCSAEWTLSGNNL